MSMPENEENLPFSCGGKKSWSGSKKKLKRKRSKPPTHRLVTGGARKGPDLRTPSRERRGERASLLRKEEREVRYPRRDLTGERGKKGAQRAGALKAEDNMKPAKNPVPETGWS